MKGLYQKPNHNRLLTSLSTFLVGRSRFFYWFASLSLVSILVLTSVLSYSYLQLQSMHGSTRQTAHIQKVDKELILLLESLSEAESRMRGYELTGNKEFISNYAQLVLHLEQSLSTLANLALHTRYPRQIHQLCELVQLRLYFLDQSLKYLKGQYRFESENTRMASIEQARRLMNQIRTIKERLQDQNRVFLAHQEATAQQTLDHALWLIILTVPILITIVIQIGVMFFKYVDKHRQAKENLRALNAQKTSFFSIISHDLRGPLGAARTLLRMMDEQYGSLSEEQKAAFRKTTLETVERTTDLLENLLLWSKSQMDRVTFDPQKVDLHSLAAAILEWNRPLAEQKQIRLVNQLEPDLMAQVDVSMFEVVLRNLISNSLKFTPSGGSICIKNTRTPTGIELQIVDTGVGMSEKVCRNLFAIDAKQSSEGTAGEKGSGFGLILCKQYVEKHKGTIHVHSQPGQGSSFHIRLPQAMAA